MKTITLFVILSITILPLKAQSPDSMRLRQIDSLHKVGNKKFISMDSARYFWKLNNWEQVIKVSKVEFDKIVRDNIALLKTKKYKDFTKEQHISIMRTANTFDFSGAYKGEFYTGFEKEFDWILYIFELNTIFKYSYNRGMGFYFPELQIEYAGTPHFFSWYQVQ